jgi:TRAP-type C4-dicarboxylate transport system permease small subunit
MRAVGWIARLQLWLAMAALAVIGCVTVADVALKYLLNRPITGAYDVVETLLPVVIFHGLPATLLRRQNIVIDLVDHVAGPRGTRALVAAADAVMLGVLVLIALAMIAPAQQALEYGDRKLELGVPLYAIWIAVLAGIAGCILVAAARVLHRSAPATRER